MCKRKCTSPHNYTAAEIRFIKSKIKGRSYAEMTDLFNRRFGLSITLIQMQSVLGRHGITNGRDCRFVPGQTPSNKGKKGCCPADSEKGWFRPEHRSWNHKTIGTERINSDGYVDVRIRNPSGKSWKNWKAKHRIIWEKAHGKIPRGHVVIFADGDRRNFALDNLLLVSRKELVMMNYLGLISGDKDLTKAGKTVADIHILIADRKRRMKNRKKLRAGGNKGASDGKRG
jgi:hypothetical protein